MVEYAAAPFLVALGAAEQLAEADSAGGRIGRPRLPARVRARKWK
jgi:hypothetical protein